MRGKRHGTAGLPAGVPAQSAGPGRGGPHGHRPGARSRDQQQTIYTWWRQDRIDRGLEPGLTSSEKAELAAAKHRIAELETELQATRRAIELIR
ncbi:hypothetical protein [Nonomuraea guangzhouensis]|uniref:Transposase n=1 Tax=Nonomuraea guangzhouensis TaxID=1291555 RepID=A0ABW4GBA0_9ACTN|nr:hypothetical protein [Nonomuraea guangzhouensis]